MFVVEDERPVRLLLTRVLESAGAEVTAVASVTEALAGIARGAPDVIVTDIRMPGEDGYDLLRRLRALPAERGGETPVVAVSASVTSDEILGIRAAGFAGFVPKPFEAAELIAAVASVVGRSEA